MSDSNSAHRMIGASVLPEQGAAFPLSGLTQAMYAAMQGELDLLLVSDWRLLGRSPQQIQEISAAFEHYGVSVKSASSSGSKSS